MLILRLLFILSALAIALSCGFYLLTHNRRYLVLAWQIAKFILFALVVIVLLYVLERYALTGWRIMV